MTDLLDLTSSDMARELALGGWIDPRDSPRSAVRSMWE